MRDDKYVVFKRPDLDGWLAGIIDKLGMSYPAGTTSELLEAVVQDAVVIRRQDVFAPPALEAYANAIMSAVEMMAPLLLLTDNPASDAMVEQVRDLRDIADYFHAQAQEAWLTSRKIPDL